MSGETVSSTWFIGSNNNLMSVCRKVGFIQQTIKPKSNRQEQNKLDPSNKAERVYSQDKEQNKTETKQTGKSQTDKGLEGVLGKQSLFDLSIHTFIKSGS